MANSVDPDQTAPIGAVCSGSTLFASIVSNARQLFAEDDFSRRHFQIHFFLGALMVKQKICLQMTLPVGETIDFFSPFTTNVVCFSICC